MLEKILIFMVFLCPLVFFHELGHFFFARLFGVRVEVFSIGFGPKLLRFRPKDTEYAFSLIPLGGYVKMFGDDPLAKDTIPEELRGVSFTFKNKWARFWIVMGGPLANFVMAFAIFFLLLLTGEKVPEFKFGMIKENSVLYTKGVRTGDIVLKVNGNDVFNSSDISEEAGTLIKNITVDRFSQHIELPIEMNSKGFFEEFVKTPVALRKPIFVDKKGNRFQIELWDTGKNEKALYSNVSLEQIPDLLENMGLKIVPLIASKGTEVETLDWEKSIDVSSDKKDLEGLLGTLTGLGYYPTDLLVKSVNMKSPADKAGMKGNDLITKIDGSSVTSFDGLKEKLQSTKNTTVKISVWRSGEEKELVIIPEEQKQDGKIVRLMGVYSGGEFFGPKMIQTKPKSFWQSIVIGSSRTWDTIVKTMTGFKKLITNEVSLKNIGGPLAIGKVASDSFNTSLSYFFQVMALISVNLGVINLFPIPVLDGGHIMFIILEIVNRGPLSQRKMEIAQQFGLSLLLILTFAALFNDFTRFFNV